MAAQPWERQKGESDRAYSLFLIYRNQAVPRSTSALARGEYVQGPDGPNPDNHPIPTEQKLREFSARWKWVDRSRSWDNWLQSARDREAAADARKWERRRIKALDEAYEDAQAIRAKLRLMLRFPVADKRIERITKADGKTIEEIHLHPVRWAARDMATFAKVVAEIEQGVIGAATSDPSSLSDRELDAILDAHKP